MKFVNFITLLAQKITGPLGEFGFKKTTDDLFVRFKEGHDISVISIQKHSSEPKVCVNFGVHYDFLPKLGTTELAEDGKIELSDCEVKVRVTPESELNDYWWSFDTEAIEDISDLVLNRVEKFFSRYDIDGDITTITPEDLDGEMPDVIAPLTKVRASLVLARIHEVSGNTGKASSFAKYGIKAAGMAVGPKKVLKDILKRIEQKS
jgi:hypothetical protein